MADQRNTAESALHSVITASAGDKLVKNLVAEAARTARTEYCSTCNQHGGNNGRLCAPTGIHYGRVLAAHIAGKVSDAHLIAVQTTLGSQAPVQEKLLQLEAWQALQATSATSVKAHRNRLSSVPSLSSP